MTTGVTLDEAKARMAAGEACIVDLREAYHLDRWALEGALHAPLARLLAGDVQLPRDRALILLGHRASEAAFAARFLAQQGLDARPMAQGAPTG